MERKVDVEEFKEELWDIVVEFGEPILMRTGLDKVTREELIHIQETRPKTEPKSCKDSSTLKMKSENKKLKTKLSNKDKPIIISKNITIPNAEKVEKKLLET